MEPGRLGIWASLDGMTAAASLDFARRVERWGYGALWMPESRGRNVLVHSAYLLAGTTRLLIAPGIANIYARDAVAMANAQRGLAEQSGGRFLLGVGVSHVPLVAGCAATSTASRSPRCAPICRRCARLPTWRRHRRRRRAPWWRPSVRACWRSRPNSPTARIPTTRHPRTPPRRGKSSGRTNCCAPSRWCCWRPIRRGRAGRPAGARAVSAA